MHRLFQRVLVVVAHPDDETGGCGVMLQRASDPMVMFATEGAPDDHWFWSGYQSQAAYARTRRAEALAALRLCGVDRYRFISDEHPWCSDQRLFRALPQALQAVTRATMDYRPDALLAPAYEGGHPDHDACSLIAHVVGKRFSLPVWEMPLYHRLPSGQLACQQFLNCNGTECLLRPSKEELTCKREMLACYRSQPSLARFVVSRVERFRLQPAYDYARPPHPGLLNYEAWQWPMQGPDVSKAFADCLRKLGTGWIPSRTVQRATLQPGA